MSVPTTQDDGGLVPFRLRFRIRTLILIVACCAPASWIARELWDRRPENALARALRMMRSDDPEDRFQGAMVVSQKVVLNELTRPQLDAVMPFIFVALRDPEPRVRREAMEAILCLVYDSAHGSGVLPHAEEIVTALPERLRDPAENVHRNSMLTLQYIYHEYKTAWTVEPPLPKDPDRFLDTLCHLMEQRGGETPPWAFQVLHETAPRLDRTPPERLLKALRSLYPEVRMRAVLIVVRFKHIDEALSAMLEVIEGDDDPAIRARCSRALAGINPSPAALPVLVEALRNRSRDVRFIAVQLLGRIGPKASPAVPAIMPLLDEPAEPGPDDPAVAAAAALGAIAPGTDQAPIAATALESFLGRIKPPWRRQDAEGSLRKIRSAATPGPSGVAN